MTYPPEPDPLRPAMPFDGYAVPPDLYVVDEPLISADIGGWWSRGMTVVRNGWQPLALVQGIGALVSFLAGSGIAVAELGVTNRLVQSPGAPPPDAGQVFGDLLPQLGYALAGAAVSGFVSLLVTLVTVHLVVQIAAGRRADVGRAVRAALPRVLPLFGWSLLAGLIMLGGICACFLPFLYFLAVFTVLGPVVMIERGAAIGRCFRLFHGDLGASLGRIATIIGLAFGVGLVSSVVSFAVSAASGGLTAGHGTQVVAVLVGTAIGTALQAALGVFTGPLTLLTYADQRARVEPLRSTDLVRELGLDEGPNPAFHAATP